MHILSTLVDLNALARVSAFGFIGGVAIPAAFSLGVVGLVRASDSRRTGGLPLAVAYTTMATIFFAVFTAAVALGVVIMTNK